MLGKVKVDKAPMYNGAAARLTNRIFPMGHYLDIIAVTNGNMCS